MPPMQMPKTDAPKVDLTNCDREPIHIPGSVQPHGVLLVLDADYNVVQASRSVEAHLGFTAEAVLGNRLSTLIVAEDAQEVVDRIADGPLELHPVYLTSIRAQAVETVFDAIVHRNKDGLLVLELEPTDLNAAPDLHRTVQSVLVNLRGPGTLRHLCDYIAQQVRRMTGFHRVMVYRFDDQWNGKVVAEAKVEDVEPFLGLNYPASDIPKQARELYVKNWLRFIADRDYVPSPVVPNDTPARNGADGRPLDMSFAVLRSVSPIHLEYLRNMGVGASMSISLVDGGKLWGLIACHHYTPRRVPYEVRTACELLAQVLSLQVAAREQAELTADVRRSHDAVNRLVDRMDAGENFADTLADQAADLLAVLHADGAAVIDGNLVVRVGQTPGEAQIRMLADRVEARPAAFGTGDVFATDFLSDLTGGNTLDLTASGLLSLRPTRLGRRWLLFFRGEHVRTVNWAGDPAKTVAKGEDARLSPRGSFALWKQTLTGRSSPWTDADLATAEDLRRGIQAKVIAHAEEIARNNQTLRQTNAEREQMLDSERAARNESERLGKMKDEFVATLSHELRTPLTAIQGWAHLMRSAPQTPAEMEEGLEIIERNARAQGQMVEDLLDMSRITSGKLRLDVQPVQLPQVCDSAIAAVQIAAKNKDIRLQKVLDPMTGIHVTGDPHRLQQVLWNLLTNAIKFTPKGGKVKVDLRRVNSHVELSVSDSGIGIPAEFLPHVFDRFRQADSSSSRVYGGLGLGLAIVRNLVEMHGGGIRADSGGAGHGTTFTVTLPVRAVAPAEANEHPRTTHNNGGLNCDDLHLSGVRVLVVDDEPDTRELVCRVLRECHVSVTPAGSVAEAMEKIAAGTFDVLVSDIGMPGEDGYGLIRRLRELEKKGRERTPAIALTAYARAQDRQKIMLAGFQVHVAKPVEAAELLATVASLAGRV